MRCRIKVLDFLFIALFFGAIIFLFFKTFTKSGGELILFVSSPKGEYIFPLTENQVLNVEGILGDTLIKISDNVACVIDSPCENKNCIQMGNLSSEGDFSACLPNGIIVRVESSRKNNSQFDAVTK